MDGNEETLGMQNGSQCNGIYEMVRIDLFGGLDVCERSEILSAIHSGESTFRSLYYV